jgi:hypothetical protein
MCARWVSSALVGARTERNRTAPVRALDVHPVEEQYVEMEPTGLTERLRDALKSGD